MAQKLEIRGIFILMMEQSLAIRQYGVYGGVPCKKIGERN